MTEVITKGTTPKDKSGKGSINFVKVENINKSSGEIDIKSKITENEHEGYLKRSQLKDGDILFSIAGTLGRTAIVKKELLPANTNQALAIIRLDEGDKNYITTFLNGRAAEDFIKKNPTVGAQPNLSLEQVGNLLIEIPSLEEQTKIGSFFKQLDDTIALHQRKLTLLEQLKQTYLQQMFPQDENNFPVLRIAGISQPWVLRRLSDVSERVRGNDGRMDLPTLTISAGSGWLDQRERFSGNIAGNEQKNYTLLSNGELSYNHGNSKLAKYGVVFALRTFEEALVPKVYHSFKTTDEASADFVEYMFATKRPDRELAKLVSSGARMDGLLNINYDEFMGIDIMVPEIDEQNRISHFLRNFDDTILLHRCKIEKLTELKKVLLAKMFL